MRSTVARWGNSLAIRLPKPTVDTAALHEGDAVDIAVEDGRIILEPSRHVDVNAMIAAIRPDNLPEEKLDVAPIGHELL